MKCKCCERDQRGRDELEEELSQARKLIAELVKMGEFYSNGDAFNPDYDSIREERDSDACNPNDDFLFKGKLAREVLSNNKDLIEKLTKE